jgi:hypothetical protein
LATTLQPIAPLPTPLDVSTVNQLRSLEAVQGQPGPVVTVTCPVPPSPGTVIARVDRVYVQFCASANEGAAIDRAIAKEICRI